MKKDQKRLNTLNLYDKEKELADVCSALSVKNRREIIKLINQSPLTINEIAWKLNIPVSTASFHTKILVKAGLLMVSSTEKKVTNQKTISLGNYFYTMNLGDTRVKAKIEPQKHTNTINIPIGSYADFYVESPCGINTPQGILLISDTPAVFSSPERFNAGSIWLKRGYLKYDIPLLDFSGSKTTAIRYDDKSKIISLSFTLELCAETINYDHNCKSLLTVSVNENPACKIKLNGDFGERRGKLNPTWLQDNLTQYGLLYNVDIRLDGTYLNEKKVSELSIKDLDLTKKDILTFKLEVTPDTKRKGGINLFGKTFGDYPQDIVLNVTYLK